MFLSIHNNNHSYIKRNIFVPSFSLITPPKIDDYYLYNYIIYDDIFTEDWVGRCKQKLFKTEVRCGAIIDCYEAKNIDVPYQLYLYHKYMQKTYSWYQLDQEIEFNIQHTPKYSYYANDVKKFLNKMDSLKAFW